MNRPVIRDDLLRVHAEDAAHFLHLRRLRTEAPNVRLTDIYDADQRLRAHLNFLKICGAPARETTLSLLTDAPDYGEAVVHAFVLLQSGETDVAGPVVALVEDRDIAIDAVAAAFGFCAKDIHRQYLGGWIQSKDPVLVAIALQAAISFRLNLRDLLPPLFANADPGVRARAFDYAGVMGLIAHGPVVEAAATDDKDPGAAFAARVAGCRIASGATAEALVLSIGPDLGPDRCRVAIETGFLGLGQDRARDIVRTLLAAEDTRRWGVLGLGVIGARRTIEFLIAEMQRPDMARIAGWAFSLMTGANVAEDDLELDVFPEDAENPVIEPSTLETFLEDSLPWPDPARVQAWMAENGDRLSPEHPLLFGMARWSYRDMDSPDLLFQGRYRALAQTLAMQTPGSPLPNWRNGVHLSGGRFQRDWQA